jgi:hypothetical protein
MKTFVCILAIFALTTPLWAQTVDFTVSGASSKVQIGYENNGVSAANLPVGIALKVVVTGCEITALDSYDNTDFPAYIDYAYTEEDSGDGYSPLGEGHPLAAQENAPGRLELSALGEGNNVTTLYICMGRVQDGVAGPNPGPESVANLVTLSVKDTGGDNVGSVSVYEDTSSRGGVVGGGDPIATNLPVEDVPIEFGCFPPCLPGYQAWLDYGEFLGMPAGTGPECWCYPRQCYGDTDNQLEGALKKWAVGALDIATLVSAWKVQEPPNGPGCDATQICADLDHQEEGALKKWRVGALDIAIMVANWKVQEPPNGPGTPTDCLECP